MTQKDIYELLQKNPLNVDVWVGDLDDLNGKDYIFLDFLNDDLIGSDDSGVYQSFIQITVATKSFDNRATLVQFIKKYFNVSVEYERSTEFQYFLARCQTGVLLNG